MWAMIFQRTMGSGVSGSHLLDLCLQICEIGITPDELKQIVREAVLETMTVKKGAITCSHVGNRFLFSQDDIDKALSKNRNNKSL